MGIGKLFDFSGSYEKYNASDTGEDADTKAIFLDWLAVGEDLEYALNKFETEKGGTT